jgi:1-acyl-sn-glycerol-3-phosphate acyltransferase
MFLVKYIAGIKTKIIYQSQIGKPFIIASKHESIWETIFLLYLFKNPVFVIKKELTKIPFYGWYLEKMGMIAIDRSQGVQALKKIKYGAEETFKQNRILIIFPEGSRTSSNYHSGILFLHKLYNNIPIVPTYLDSGKLWAKDMLPQPGIITIKFLQPIIEYDPNLLTTLKTTIDSC